MVIQYKCPGCGADMVFNSKTGKLYCESCGHSEEIEGYESEDFQEFEEHFHTSTFGDDEINQYQCNNCGAILITDKDTTATTCSFCGSPVILGDRLSGALAPSKVIPFSISKREAEAAFKKWCHHGLLMPKGFKQADRIKSLTGMYVPFWLYNLQGQCEAVAHCTRVHTYDEGDSIVTKTNHFDVYRKADLRYNNVPADASEKMPDDLMDKLEPFDYNNIREFNTPYLAGFISEKYNYTDKEMFPRVQQRVMHYMDNYILNSIKGYSAKSIINRDYNTRQISAEYALFPVWVVYYDYGRSEYTFAMNGQTGKIAGKPPISTGKIFGSITGITVLLFAICRIITILMGGPLLW
ncbi:MAG: TFIIB-type zinc ribbon-containing protein [Lachnospiraceae bacterium]